MGNPTRKKTAGPADNMDLGRSAPGLGRCVARLSSTMAGPRSHLCAQATLVGLPSPTAGEGDPGQGGKIEELGGPTHFCLRP